MSTKLEINISALINIKVEIVLEAPGGKLISKSRWGMDEKRGEIFFSHFSGKNKKRGATDFLFHF